MRKLYYLILSLGILTACDKDENNKPELSFPATFSANEFRSTTPARMYTLHGEVKDAALIQSFMRKYGATQNLQDRMKVVPGEKLTLLSSSKAEWFAGDLPAHYDTRWTDNQLELTSLKEGTVMYNQTDEAYINFVAGISKYKPLVYDKKIVSGNTYLHKTKAQLFATLSGNELHVIYMAHTLKSGDKNAFMVRGAISSNYFDAAGLTLLRDKDTLVVQEFAGVSVKE